MDEIDMEDTQELHGMDQVEYMRALEEKSIVDAITVIDNAIQDDARNANMIAEVVIMAMNENVAFRNKVLGGLRHGI